MKEIKSIIENIEKKWAKPANAIHRGNEIPFQLICSFNKKNENQIISMSIEIPKDLELFWMSYEGGLLFKDIEYGQWGLEILSQNESLIETDIHIKERTQDFKNTDLVIGRFLGDADLLVISCNKDDFGNVYISLPLDTRQDWYKAANSFSDFLELYSKYEGDKYWELNEY